MEVLVYLFTDRCMQLSIMGYKGCSRTAERTVACAGCPDPCVLVKSRKKEESATSLGATE